MYHRLRLHLLTRQLNEFGFRGRAPVGRLRAAKATTTGARIMSMSTFTLPGSSLRVNSTPDLTRDDLLSFPAFKTWLSTLQNSLARQSSPSHEFHDDPYVLRQIDIQAVDRFGGGRLGFIKLKADVSNGRGEKLPGSVFLRGGSVGMLVCSLFSSSPDPCLSIIVTTILSSSSFNQTTSPHPRKKENRPF